MYNKTLTVASFFTAWLICAQPLFGQEIYFTNRAETLYERSFSASIPITMLDEGTIISHISNASHFFDRSSGVPVPVFMVEVQTESGLTGWLAADAVSVRNSVTLPERIIKSRWTHSYYLDVLRSGHRERLFEHEPFWRDHHPETIGPWYGIATVSNGARFHNIFVVMTELSSNDYWFINRRIEEKGGAYFIYATCVRKTVYAEPYHFGRYFSEGETARFALHLDGDFLDVFMDGSMIFTFVNLDDELGRQFGNLMWGRNEPVDLSRIVWPRRADGTMDIPPPGVGMAGFETSHMTTARLRVRDDPDTDSLIVTTLDTGAEVQVLETGPVETIGETTAPWARVLTASGFTGWAFSGSLEPIALAVEPEAPDPIIAEAPDEQPVPIAVATPTGQPMPLWALPMLVGGVAVAVVLVVLVKRKK